ncbi:Uncharacterised protein [Streptococcus pneumoniae]|nr:Rep protein [Bacillus cereus AH820]EJR41446.1 hypothetical protein IIK_05801 [Bacillus cereus VD102]KKC52079.1 Rep protein [Bacillus sp. UMTAT18]CGG56089.1 Uncharacterised protein [Streptococcus pneumoniae]SMD59073.1 hypothetical protein BACERE00184_00002 [Bacillus cereus]SMD64186.1 hypothetical protein BACERE00185_00008 [Bacillus mobilis]
MDNINYLTEIGYLSSKEEAFLFKLASFVEFKTNVIVERETGSPASPTYLSEKFKIARQNISGTMNTLLKKGVLAVAQAGVTTEDGRVCTSRTWFVNPNIMCCSPKDGIDKATQHIFRDSLQNFKLEEKGKKRSINFLFICFKEYKFLLYSFFFCYFPIVRCHENMTPNIL